MCGMLHLNTGHVGAVTEVRSLALCWWTDALRGSPELWELDGCKQVLPVLSRVVHGKSR